MKEAIMGLGRHFLTFVGGLLASKGTIAESDIEIAVGAIVTLVGIVWSVVAKRKKAPAVE